MEDLCAKTSHCEATGEVSNVRYFEREWMD
jgi:hypothetical protein